MPGGPGALPHAGTPAAEFGPGLLRAVRAAWVAAGLCRNTVNAQVGRARRCFQWGVGRGLVPPGVVVALRAVEGLRAGRTEAPDRPHRRPVPFAVVERTLPHLDAVTAAMMRLQRLAGMRPGEVCALRPADLDTAADVWRYAVARPKNLHRGRTQVYYLGPRARAVLEPHLAGKAPGERAFPVARDAYCRRVRVACHRAGVERWTPHQLRHAFATEVAEHFRSLGHAAAIGDTDAVARAVYVHVDPRERARIEVARELG